MRIHDAFFTAVEYHLRQLKLSNGVLLNAELLNRLRQPTREGSEIGRQIMSALVDERINRLVLEIT